MCNSSCAPKVPLTLTKPEELKETLMLFGTIMFEERVDDNGDYYGEESNNNNGTLQSLVVLVRECTAGCWRNNTYVCACE